MALLLDFDSPNPQNLPIPPLYGNTDVDTVNFIVGGLGAAVGLVAAGIEGCCNDD
jgi:hypothetical protein